MTLSEQLRRYQASHQSDGILIDTNLLVLILAAEYRPDLVGVGRLQKYQPGDADLLVDFVQGFARILTTCHVLAETSNLLRQLVRGKEQERILLALHPLFCLDEVPALGHCTVDRRNVLRPLFVRLGMTDAGLAQVATTGRLLLTDDLGLHVAVSSAGGASINFTHMREAAGLL